MKPLYSPGSPRDTCSSSPDSSRIRQEAQTRVLTCLPRSVSICLRVRSPCFRPRHPLAFSWLLVRQLLSGERATLRALARHGPSQLAYQQYRRRLCAAYWCTKPWLGWVADQALQAFPPPEEGGLELVGDSTLKPKRGQPPPVAQNTRLSPPHPDVFGFRIVLLMAQGGVARIPVDCALLRRQDDPSDQPAKALLRQMLREFQSPAWGPEVSVVAEAAYAARDNLALSQECGYWQVLAFPRPWKFSKGKALHALVTHLPRWWSTQIRRPTAAGRRRPVWIDAKAVRRRHVGQVTVVLSKGRRHEGPKQTKRLVTHLPELVPARQIVALYVRRGWVAVLVREVQGVVGVGQHQVTKQVGRVERSVAVAIMAYLRRLKLRATDIPADRPWSAFRLPRALAWEMVQAQGARSARQRARKWLQTAQAA